jgi:hypothetical protein
LDQASDTRLIERIRVDSNKRCHNVDIARAAIDKVVAQAGKSGEDEVQRQ